MCFFKEFFLKDHTGHLYGPNSKEIADKLKYIDEVVGYLIEELRNHHLFDKMNLIITSDHGMETISNKSAIFLDKYIDMNLIEPFGSRALYNIFVKDR